jgi:hypothetical protein
MPGPQDYAWRVLPDGRQVRINATTHVLEVFDTDGSTLLTSAGIDTTGVRMWATGTAYAVNDHVNSGDRLYRCTTAHTSSAAFATDLASKWTAVDAANLSVANNTATTVDVASSAGTSATVPAATTTTAGVLSAADKVKLNATSGTNTGDQATNLGTASITATTLDVTSSSGTAATLPAATTSAAGLLGATDKVKLNATSGTNTGDQATNLGVAGQTATTLDVTSSTGTAVTLPAATTSAAGLLSSADKTKLNATSGTNTGDQATNLGVASNTATALNITSSTGTATTVPAVTTSLAGLMVAADKTKLDAVTGTNTGDETGAGILTKLNTVAGLNYTTGSTTLVTVPGLTATGAVTYSGVITPTTLAANANDYAPAGFPTAATVRVSASVAVSITGLAGGAAGRQVTLANVGTFAITLPNANAGSVAANRFSFAADLVLRGGDSATLTYDGTTSTWRVSSPAGALTGPAGATTQVQYNNGGVLAGSANLTYDNVNTLSTVNLNLSGIEAYTAATDPAAPAGTVVDVWATTTLAAGRPMLATRSAIGAPAPLGPWAGSFRGHAAIPQTGVGTVTTYGYAALTAVPGFTARSIASTNLFTRARRVGLVSTAVAGNVTSVRGGAGQLLLGNGTLGGFVTTIRFGCSDAATVAGARQFVGISSSLVAPTNVEPSTLLNCVGVGHGAANTNLFIYSGTAVAAATPIDLGASFPANTLSTDWYELILYAAPAGTNVQYRVNRLNTGATASGTILAANLPNNTQVLNPLWMWRTNNATALAVGLDFGGAYYEQIDA